MAVPDKVPPEMEMLAPSPLHPSAPTLKSKDCNALKLLALAVVQAEIKTAQKSTILFLYRQFINGAGMEIAIKGALQTMITKRNCSDKALCVKSHYMKNESLTADSPLIDRTTKHSPNNRCSLAVFMRVAMPQKAPVAKVGSLPLIGQGDAAGLRVAAVFPQKDTLPSAET